MRWDLARINNIVIVIDWFSQPYCRQRNYLDDQPYVYPMGFPIDFINFIPLPPYEIFFEECHHRNFSKNLSLVYSRNISSKFKIARSTVFVSQSVLEFN